MHEPIVLTFDRGTLLLGGSDAGALPFVAWDARVGSFRAPAHRFGAIATYADALGGRIEGDLRAAWKGTSRPTDALALRTYQRDALRSWHAFDRRGIVALPTGAGKTRVAIAAILELGVPTVVLCPTRALLSAWSAQLAEVLRDPIGAVGDGERRVERVTVMTFESAYRHLDALGHRFGLLVVDEVHHFASGARTEALEACAAPARLGLTATAPAPGSEGAARLADLVGPLVIEVAMRDLVGRHLAPLSMLRMAVRLAPDERSEYDRLVARFSVMSRSFFRQSRGADYGELLRFLASSTEGRLALKEHARACDLAFFPRAKRELVAALLERHREDRTIVFTARAEDAYRIAERELVPAITGEVRSRERERILRDFKDGRVRAIASARVLNEGIDVPDARVAILVGGMLGERELVQRIGRVLRPAPGKEAVAYEIFTADTIDERRALHRGRNAPLAVAHQLSHP